MDAIGEMVESVMDDATPGEVSRPARLVTIVEGYVTDDETGEVYGLVEDCHLVECEDSHEEFLYTPMDKAPAFRVDSHETADWVLSKRFEEEAALKSIEARRAAMNANFDRMAQVHVDRLKHLSFRFDAELEDFAKANLPRGKKTLVLPHGSIGFRTIAASVVLRDEDRAIQWATIAAPEIVQKHVTKTDVVKAWKAYSPDTGLPLFLEAVPARESVKISTGL